MQPQRLGKYEILSTLGMGGMGCVYRARIEGLGGASKEVALKVVHPHLSEDKGFVMMFLNETRLAMSLSHRNIVQTFDAGMIDDQYYLAMELVDGCTLRSLIDQIAGRELLPVDIALFVTMEVSAALAYAHGLRPNGVIHRDISPGNILLSSQGDVKLADFGVAKAADQLFVTTPNLIKGKRQYMAPEQARGQPEPRSDIFSLGAVLYELLSGEPARKGFGLEELSLGPARLRPPSAFRTHVSGLDGLVLSMLHLDPAKRPSSAEELRRTLVKTSFQLRSQDSISIDPHARLRSYLASHLVRAPEAMPDRNAGQARLAQVVLQHALAVPEDTECRGEPSAAPVPVAARETTEAPLALLGTETGEKTNPAIVISQLCPAGHRSVPPVQALRTEVDVRPSAAAEDPATRGRASAERKWTDAVTALDAAATPPIEPATPPPVIRNAGEPALVEPILDSIQILDAPSVTARSSGRVSWGRRLQRHARRSLSFRLAAAASALLLLGAGLTAVVALSREAADPSLAGAIANPGSLDAAAPQLPNAAGSETARSDVSRADAGLTSTERDAAASARMVTSADGAAPVGRAPHRVVRLKSAVGYLDLNSLPWAQVYIDGQHMGATPLERLPLRPGPHTVRLVSPKHQLSRTYQVNIQAGRGTVRVYVLR